MRNLNKRQKSKVEKQKLEYRKNLWPSLDKSKLWDRQTTDGWLSVPRALPLILRIMDKLATKGQPVSHAYLDLWCRTFDDSFVIVSKPREMAYYSGFSGERAERTWGTRIRCLQELGFIDFKEGISGPINYVLIYNPYQIIEQHYKKQAVSEKDFIALKFRAMEIGANEFKEEAIKVSPNSDAKSKSD